LIRHAHKIKFVGEYFIGWHLFAGRVFGRVDLFASCPLGVDKANAGGPQFQENSL
jgi:hypothetical protein